LTFDFTAAGGRVDNPLSLWNVQLSRAPS